MCTFFPQHRLLKSRTSALRPDAGGCHGTGRSFSAVHRRSNTCTWQPPGPPTSGFRLSITNDCLAEIKKQRNFGILCFLYRACVLLHRSDRGSGILPHLQHLLGLASLQWINVVTKRAKELRRWRGPSKVQGRMGTNSWWMRLEPRTGREIVLVFAGRRLSPLWKALSAGGPRLRVCPQWQVSPRSSQTTPSPSRRLYRLDGVEAKIPTREARADPHVLVRSNIMAFALRVVSSRSRY